MNATFDCKGCVDGSHHFHPRRIVGIQVGDRCECGALTVTKTIATNGTTQRYEVALTKAS